MVHEDYDEPTCSGWVTISLAFDVDDCEGNESVIDEILLDVRKKLDGMKLRKGIKYENAELDMWSISEDWKPEAAYNAAEERADAKRKYDE